ncbi:MAG: hypothetical protein QG551_403, partial [Patescibacteria group bacterium]|nr:hypothetical protein [Patescibacteria group bacterium]
MKNLKKYFFIAPLFLFTFLLTTQKVNAEDVANVGQEVTVDEKTSFETKEENNQADFSDNKDTPPPAEETNKEEKETEDSSLVGDIIDFVQDALGGNEPPTEETIPSVETDLLQPNEELAPVEEIPVAEELTLFEEIKIEVLNIMEEITDFFTVDTREEVVIEPRREVEIEKENIDYTNTSDSCKADPFIVDISNGMKTTTIYTIDTKSKETARKIQIGDLPQGIDVKFGSNNSYSKNVKDGETKFILEI